MKKVSTVSLEYRPNRWRSVWNNREFYLLMLPGVIITIIFSYMPMYGILMAFQDVKVGQSVSEATWVGWSNFERLFKMRMFRIALENTLTLNIVSLLFSIPMPIILALFLHNTLFYRLNELLKPPAIALFSFNCRSCRIINYLQRRNGDQYQISNRATKISFLR